MRRTILAGAVDSQNPGRSSAYANSTQSCRPREALLSSGQLCLKSGTPFEQSEIAGVFGMKRLRLGSALAGVAVCAVACAVLWPHARDAGALLAAPDDPLELAHIQLR